MRRTSCLTNVPYDGYEGHVRDIGTRNRGKTGHCLGPEPKVPWATSELEQVGIGAAESEAFSADSCAFDFDP